MARSNKYEHILRYIVEAELLQPLHIGDSSGDKTGILVHPVDRKPFIQASSLAGMFRDYSTIKFGRRETEKFFGSSRIREDENASENGSRIIISDGVFHTNRSMYVELRPHVAIDPESGTAKDKSKFNMEYIGTGAAFTFEVTAYAENENKQELEKLVMSCLSALNNGDIQIGGKKSSGCGFVRISKLRYKAFDMTSAADRKAWMKPDDGNFSGYRNATSELSNTESGRRAYSIMLCGEPESGLLVKSISPKTKEEGKPDQENIRNARGDAIIPGSSIKGVLRHRVAAIADYLESKGRISSSDEAVINMFGSKSEKDEDAHVGNVVTRDAVITEPVTTDIKRIHIDKFTGGVIDGALFSEEVVSGKKLDIHVDILDSKYADMSAALILMAMRDIAIRAVNFGSGYNVGRGFIDADEILIQDMKTGDKYSMKFKGGRVRKDAEDTLSAFAGKLLKEIR